MLCFETKPARVLTLDLRRPWDFDVLVMENMFGDIISDLRGGLVGGMASPRYARRRGSSTKR